MQWYLERFKNLSKVFIYGYYPNEDIIRIILQNPKLKSITTNNISKDTINSIDPHHILNIKTSWNLMEMIKLYF